MLKNLARTNALHSIGLLYADTSSQAYGKKSNDIRTKYQDVVTERRIERCSPGLRPSDRFYEVSFRYPSPGIEGEKCRPLDHM